MAAFPGACGGGVEEKPRNDDSFSGCCYFHVAVKVIRSLVESG